jgi:hypothetical protein
MLVPTIRQPVRAISCRLMPRDPNIPDAFDVYTLVLLRRPANAQDVPDHELDALQTGRRRPPTGSQRPA